MLSINRFQVLGQYFTDYYIIKLKEYNFPEDCMSGDGLNTFIHEYVHYLQNITTIYGSLFFFHRFRSLVSLGKIIEKLTDVYIPIYKSPEYKKNKGDIENVIVEYMEWFRYLNGGSKEKVLSSFNRILECDSEIKKLKIYGEESSARRWKLKLSDNYNQIDYYLGAECIQEGLSYGIEQLLGTTEVLNFIPYRLIETLLLKKYPDIPLINTIIIQEACLLHEIPAISFYKIFKQYGNIEMNIKKDPESLSKYLFNFLNENNEIEKSIEAIESSFNDILNNIRADDCFCNVIKMFYANLKKSLNKRKSDSFYFIRPFWQYRTEPSRLTNFIEDIPTPIILDKKNISVVKQQINNNSNCILLITSLWNAIQLFAGCTKNQSCILYNYCTLEKIKDSDCLSQPWIKVNTGNTCPYGMACAILGLRNKTIIR